MAAAMPFSNPSLFNILTVSILLSASCFGTTDSFNKPMKQKISQFHLYWHDIFSGSDPTSIQIVDSPQNMTVGFGAVIMIDDPLTMGPELSSKEVGRAQGFYSLVSQEDISLSMTMNFVFTFGKYNGSTITILGSNHVSLPVREIPVIGGTGLFRFACGYAKIRTIRFNPKTKDATVEYNITVMHY